MTDAPHQAAALYIRRGMPADVEGIYELSLRALHQSAATFYTSAQLDAWASLRTLTGHRKMIEDTYLLVAECGGDLCGFANLQLETGLVDQLFVDPAAGGRGVATELLAELEQHATSLGLAHVTSHASKRAVHVFERCGYERLEVEQVRIGGELLERFLVRKCL